MKNSAVFSLSFFFLFAGVSSWAQDCDRYTRFSVEPSLSDLQQGEHCLNEKLKDLEVTRDYSGDIWELQNKLRQTEVDLHTVESKIETLEDRLNTAEERLSAAEHRLRMVRVKALSFWFKQTIRQGAALSKRRPKALPLWSAVSSGLS